jgi:hypothetical protein
MRPTRSAQAARDGQTLPAAGPPHWKKRSDVLKDIRRFLILSWSQGVKSPYRGQFWRQLYGVWQNNPSRMVRYLRTLAYGEDFFPFREALLRYRNNVKAQEQKNEPRLSAAAS